MVLTALFSVVSGIHPNVEVGQIYVTDCPGLEEAKELQQSDHFKKLAESVFWYKGDIQRVELLVTQEPLVKRHENSNTVIIPYNLCVSL